MKKHEKVLKAITANKEITKDINNVSHYTAEQFINDAKRYIKAIKEDRMICKIESVSKSGMSRNLYFVAMEKHKNENRYALLNFNCLFLALGYKRRGDAFYISGCGMNMVFATNYNIIYDLKRLGLLNQKESARLSQCTPRVI